MLREDIQSMYGDTFPPDLDQFKDVVQKCVQNGLREINTKCIYYINKYKVYIISKSVEAGYSCPGPDTTGSRQCQGALKRYKETRGEGHGAHRQATNLEEEGLQEHTPVPHHFPGKEILLHPQKPENLQ